MSNCARHILKIFNRILFACITEPVIQIMKLVGELALLLVCLKLGLGVVSLPPLLAPGEDHLIVLTLSPPTKNSHLCKVGQFPMGSPVGI